MKRLARPVLGFKAFWAAWRILASIEVRQAIRKGQRKSTRRVPQPPTEQCYSLAAYNTTGEGSLPLPLKIATQPEPGAK